MHVHTINKVWEQKSGDWDTKTLPYRGTQVSIKISTGGGTDMGSQVDINSCTDACSYSNQGLWPQMIGGGSFNWIGDLWSERRPPIGVGRSNQSWELHSEVGTPVRVGSSNQRWDLQSEVRPPIGGGISNQRWELQSEVSPPITGGTSN